MKINKAIHVLFVVISLLFVLPFILVLSISLSDEKFLGLHGYKFIPEQFSIAAYEVVFKAPWIILRAYGVTISVTLIGTFLGLAFTVLIAYTISRRDYMFRKITTFYVFFTMLFSGGLVPFYILVTQYLHMKDTVWAMILPSLLSPFYIMVMKGFLELLPGEILESAKIDGAGEWRTFFTIVLPLSVPALTTIGLFISFGYWNDWWNALLFINDNRLIPLQLMLYKIMDSIEFLSKNPQVLSANINPATFPSLSVRMAMVVVSAAPMLFVFPFFQRFFVKGLTVGSLKT